MSCTFSTTAQRNIVIPLFFSVCRYLFRWVFSTTHHATALKNKGSGSGPCKNTTKHVVITGYTENGYKSCCEITAPAPPHEGNHSPPVEEYRESSGVVPNFKKDIFSPITVWQPDTWLSRNETDRIFPKTERKKLVAKPVKIRVMQITHCAAVLTALPEIEA